MKKARYLFVAACWALAVAFLPRPALAHTHPGEFKRALSDLQANPDDLALRKEVIRLAHGLETLPPPSDEVLVLRAKAVSVVQDATKASDYLAAVDALRQATNLAPWIGALYFQKAVIETDANLPADSIKDFKLYLLATPNAPDKDRVLQRIGRQELALDKQKTQEKQSAAQQMEAAKYAVAMQAWQKRKTASTTVTVIGAIALGAGVAGVAWGYGTMSSAGYTVAPGNSGGQDYDILYEGKYWSSSSYQQYTSGQSDVSIGWIVAGVGAVVTVTGILLGPGPRPAETGLLNFDGGKLALGLPPVNMDHSGALRGTFVHAVF